MRINFILKNRFTAVVALCLFSVQFALAQNPTAPSDQQITAKVDEYMNAAVKIDRFSGSVLVARGGSPIVSKGYGMASIELNVPNTPQTAFRIGSVTKQFTATAIMLLQERGKLNVGDSICKHLADCPTTWQPVTIRHLLNHTSGIPSWTDNLTGYEAMASFPVTQAGMVELFKGKPLESAPGEKFHYNNSGYYLLGIIVERASGKFYGDFLQENFFTPLGMANTGYDGNSRRIIKNLAAGYEWQGDTIINASYLDLRIPFSTGSIYSTTEDLLRWDKALYTEKIVSRKTLDEIFTPFKSDYGYGWFVTTVKRFDRQVISHSGGMSGFTSHITRFPSERVTVIVLSNNQTVNPVKIANNLATIVFGVSYELPKPPI